MILTVRKIRFKTAIYGLNVEANGIVSVRSLKLQPSSLSRRGTVRVGNRTGKIIVVNLDVYCSRTVHGKSHTENLIVFLSSLIRVSIDLVGAVRQIQIEYTVCY